jgi:hypothetical protein
MSRLAAPSPNDDALQKLRKERYISRYRATIADYDSFLAGVRTIDGIFDALLKAELDLATAHQDRIRILEKLVESAALSEKLAETGFKQHRIGTLDYELAKYNHIDAQIKLLEAKQEAAKAGRK